MLPNAIQGTPNVSGITAVTAQTATPTAVAQQTYSIPVSTTYTVTIPQLQQSIAQLTTQISQAQAQLANLQAILAQINTLNTPITATPASTAAKT